MPSIRIHCGDQFKAVECTPSMCMAALASDSDTASMPFVSPIRPELETNTSDPEPDTSSRRRDKPFLQPQRFQHASHPAHSYQKSHTPHFDRATYHSFKRLALTYRGPRHCTEICLLQTHGRRRSTGERCALGAGSLGGILWDGVQMDRVQPEVVVGRSQAEQAVQSSHDTPALRDIPWRVCTVRERGWYLLGRVTAPLHASHILQPATVKFSNSP